MTSHETMIFEGEVCNKVTMSEQGKVYMNADMANKSSKITFGVYIASENVKTQQTLKYFAFHYKQSSGSKGYLPCSDQEGSRKLTLDQWNSFSEDVAAFIDLIEFSFNAPAGQVMYLANIIAE